MEMETLRGRVYWITGLANSGKTTIGTALYYDLKKVKNNVIILDGDLMKEVARGSEDVKYELEDRKERAKRYSNIAKLLSDQGFWVIVCTISMFEQIREWNRKNIKGYIEIFLDVPFDVLRKRDKKGIFNEKQYIEYPKNPDLIIINNGDTSVYEIVKKIKRLQPKSDDDYDRDSQYWNEYYKNTSNQKLIPSSFAKKVNELLDSKSSILELGCGNGRDSLYFLSEGHVITAIDGSNYAIDRLNEITENKPALFICDDFVKCDVVYQLYYDCIYSRFTLHAITEEQENELLSNVKKTLQYGGIFCIEARTVHDEIYGKGEMVGKNAYIYNNHYRRFINVTEFKNKLEKLGFKIMSLEESSGFSKNGDSDPILMRCIAKVID